MTDKATLEPKAAEIVERVFAGYVTHLSVRTAKQLAMNAIGLVLDEGAVTPNAETATAMRDACVEKVNAQRNELIALYQRIFTMKSTGDPKHPLQAVIDYDAKAQFEAALESLTLDQVNQQQRRK